MREPAGFARGSVNQIAPAVFYVPDVMSNVYFIGSPGQPWLLVDAGVPHTAEWIRRAAHQAYGPDARPDAIVLTHGHFDHVGALETLANEWDVPVYAHRLELPFITGRAKYPDPDPTVGGFMSQLSRLFPSTGANVSGREHAFTELGSLPGFDDWTVIHTPGHTAGHVSFFRQSDRLLIAGDAIVTINQDSFFEVMTQRKQICRPPAYLTTDWAAAAHSVRKLAGLRPSLIAAGHGIPVSGPSLPTEFERFAIRFEEYIPDQGRYVRQPAVSDENGLVFVPPPVPDPVGKAWQVAAIGAAAGLGAYMLRKRSRRNDVRELEEYEWY